jgi:hypothetical protein
MVDIGECDIEIDIEYVGQSREVIANDFVVDELLQPELLTYFVDGNDPENIVFVTLNFATLLSVAVVSISAVF